MIYLLVFVLLLAVELLYFRVANHFNIIDRPNERSSHTNIVLRGGGIIYVVGMWLYAAFFCVESWPFLVGITLVAGISFIDDIHSLPDSIRLMVQFIAMVLVFYCWGILKWENWWIVFIGLILCVGIINVYNFMDGINGINGGYTLAVLLPLAWLNEKMHFADQRLIIVALMADLVFCYFNFRPKGKAKCFAGDVGSISAALIVIFVLGSLIINTSDFTYIVFLVVYGVDSVLTIIHRVILHENIGQAHRKHAYQLMANELKIDHTLVALIYTLLQLAISVGYVLIPKTPSWHWGYLLVACFVLIVAYLVFMNSYYHLHEDYLASLKK